MDCNEICSSANEGCLLVVLLFIYISLYWESPRVTVGWCLRFTAGGLSGSSSGTALLFLLHPVDFPRFRRRAFTHFFSCRFFLIFGISAVKGWSSCSAVGAGLSGSVSPEGQCEVVGDDLWSSPGSSGALCWCANKRKL